jgi:hypothetical protein
MVCPAKVLKILAKDLCSCQYRKVKELYMGPDERVICIPDDALPQEKPGFGDDQKNKELGHEVNTIKAQYAESSLHSKLKCVLQKKVRKSHKYCAYC